MRNGHYERTKNFFVSHKRFLLQTEKMSYLWYDSLQFQATRKHFGEMGFSWGGVEIDESLREEFREIREEIGNVEIEIGRPILCWDFWMKSLGKENVRTGCHRDNRKNGKVETLC